MKEEFLRQAGREYSPVERAVALGCMAPIFLLALPAAFILLGGLIDAWLGWPVIAHGWINRILAGVMAAVGLGLAWWSIAVQFTIGRGTPAPVMATQKLIVQPPYTYCRNPMALGSIMGYLALAVWFGSLGMGLAVGIWTAALLTYIKRVEEREMELRFGDEYDAYRRRTPFMWPKFKE